MSGRLDTSYSEGLTLRLRIRLGEMPASVKRLGTLARFVVLCGLICSGPLVAQDVPRSLTGFDRSLLRRMMHRADSLLFAQRFAAAESAFADVVRADSAYAAGHLGLGTAIYYDNGSSSRHEQALAELRKALALNPNSAAAHARYGEALLPWKSAGNEPDSVLLSRANLHLDRARQLAPNWAEPCLGLYLVYEARHDTDGAGRQLRELLARDFFPKPVLDFAYDLLVSVDSGGYLVTNGDVDTYPALALQAGTGLRTDVTVVSIPLLNTPWYAKHLKKDHGLPLSFSTGELEGLESSSDSHSGRRMTPGLRILYDALEHRDAAGRSFYFALTVKREIMEPFKPRLSLEGFVYRVTGTRSNIPVNVERCTENLTRKYRPLDFSAAEVWQANSSPLTRDYSALAVDCATAYVALADAQRIRGHVGVAAGLCKQACTILVDARKWDVFEKVLDYWLRIAPEDVDALRLRRDYRGR